MSRALMHTAARMHYLDGLSQVEVSRRMEVSTATVSRLLAQAREEGIVRIEVIDIEEVGELGGRLAAALGLKAVRVSEAGRAATLAPEVGTLLTDAGLAPGGVVAIGWGRAVQSVVAAGLPPCPGVTIVPAMGGVNETEGHFQINEFVRSAAAQMGGVGQLLHAPSIVSRKLSALLEQDPGIARLIGLWDEVDAAILGIGRYERGRAGIDMSFSEAQAERIVGDVLRHYFDAEGRAIRWPGQENLLSINEEQLRRVPLCIGVAHGREKAEAIVGAARSGMVNALVTDMQAATRILELVEREDR
ncbi:transcriptional regulator [Oceanicola granulosus HTCC2516]|uniref:Transcriptional regulator n=1 Tax=Oceanicola granulosus (strain ATCC BAA-861 / DSM 15982 / KCTC 12143 / HTCC2516) TaxID=314256 RepID=Q2CGB4_OCEGH|nr:sugar-binding domain-containing protein [Oceanicola granulosus]EAR51804.1 transcriptional regulator [Oceanicola granulosus HTCC2516]